MSILSQQIGPLPGGAWLGLVGGAVGISYLSRRNRTAQAAPVPATTAQDQSSQGAVQYVGAGTGTTTMGTTTYATNEEWASAAIAVLIGMGTLPSKATNAISHVLYPDAAHPTTSEDSALYNLAAQKLGPPPSLPAQAFIPDPPSTQNTQTSVLGHAGVGYYSVGDVTTPQGVFRWIPDVATYFKDKAASSDPAHFGYYQSAPGVFSQWQDTGTGFGQAGEGTPLYEKVG